jgi:uncharacterized protein (DUF302 family)
MTTLPDNGMVHLDSPYSVTETCKRLEATVQARGLNVLARIDHGSDALKVGLKMQPAELLIFGNPKSGTPLMIASPTIAIDLPLKALVWEDVRGAVRVSYNSPEYLKQRHAVPNELLKNIAGIGTLLQDAIK